jgi:hypothetical protein
VNAIMTPIFAPTFSHRLSGCFDSMYSLCAYFSDLVDDSAGPFLDFMPKCLKALLHLIPDITEKPEQTTFSNVDNKSASVDHGLFIPWCGRIGQD